eukprot:13709663-Heterocapsa_arctica.AAC.1
MEPGTFTIEGTNSAAAYIDPGKPTCHTGNTLDWYMSGQGTNNQKTHDFSRTDQERGQNERPTGGIFQNH